jgi:hypothetical protein
MVLGGLVEHQQRRNRPATRSQQPMQSQMRGDMIADSILVASDLCQGECPASVSATTVRSCGRGEVGCRHARSRGFARRRRVAPDEAHPLRPPS